MTGSPRRKNCPRSVQKRCGIFRRNHKIYAAGDIFSHGWPIY